MISQIEPVLDDPDAYEPFLDRLQTVYRSMDSQYRRAAGRYGFECRGCEDNCCRTRFHHYTLAEYLYLRRGYVLLDESMQRAIRLRANTVQVNQSVAINYGRDLRQSCPLNTDDLCLLYEYRPMICRLHGIPYELRKPGQTVMQGSGCLMFTEQYAEGEYIKFDRTPLYASMAELERALRQALGFTTRLKMSVADMFAIKGNKCIC